MRDAPDEAEDDDLNQAASKTWAFFIGSQDAGDPSAFLVDTPGHICFITAEITHPRI
ncbi:hypothetical protein [Rhodococcus koreensis]|uniref:hypothetical protein n=1 Tax=Rhodococcus koreensis TaxID=99653 RepID=UPI0036712284